MVEEVVTVHRFRVQRSGLKKKKAMKAPRSIADAVPGYRNNVYYIAISCGELDPKKKLSVPVRVGLPVQ